MASLGVRSIERADRPHRAAAADERSTTGRRAASTSPAARGPATGRGRAAPPRARARSPCSDDSIDGSCSSAAAAGDRARASRCGLERPIENKNRAVGGLLSGEIARTRGADGLPEGTIEIALTRLGRAELRRLAGARRDARLGVTPTTTPARASPAASLVVRPPRGGHFAAEDNVIVGNVVLYGATAAARSSAASPASASRCATRARSRWSRASATTAAST